MSKRRKRRDMLITADLDALTEALTEAAKQAEDIGGKPNLLILDGAEYWKATWPKTLGKIHASLRERFGPK